MQARASLGFGEIDDGTGQPSRQSGCGRGGGAAVSGTAGAGDSGTALSAAGIELEGETPDNGVAASASIHGCSCDELAGCVSRSVRTGYYVFLSWSRPFVTTFIGSFKAWPCGAKACNRRPEQDDKPLLFEREGKGHSERIGSNRANPRRARSFFNGFLIRSRCVERSPAHREPHARMASLR